jgi:hypothetical protein
MTELVQPRSHFSFHFFIIIFVVYVVVCIVSFLIIYFLLCFVLIYRDYPNRKWTGPGEFIKSPGFFRKRRAKPPKTFALRTGPTKCNPVVNCCLFSEHQHTRRTMSAKVNVTNVNILKMRCVRGPSMACTRKWPRSAVHPSCTPPTRNTPRFACIRIAWNLVSWN